MTSQYIIYGGELSYFTRKLEAACIFYGLNFELRSKNLHDPQAIEARSGTHQVPVLHTPENWMIGDTTPILHMLDERYPARRMFPENATGVLNQIVEEYFDEWVARTMVHYRWHFEASALFASEKMAEGNAEIAARMRDWGPRACRATGTESEVQQRAAEAEYLRILEAMESQLGQTQYLMGDRPTAVDCVMLGGLRAHTNMDPDPRRVTAAFPRVVAFAEGDRDDWDGAGDLPCFPQTTAFGEFVLDEIKQTYTPYVLANAAAQSAGARACHADIYGESVSFLSRRYPEQSRQMIRERIDGLPRAEHARCIDWISERSLEAFSL